MLIQVISEKVMAKTFDSSGPWNQQVGTIKRFAISCGALLEYGI